MKEKTTVIEENRIKFMTILKQIFWDPEKEEVEDVSEMKNISEEEMKEFKSAEKRLKKLEEEYGTEPKKVKTNKKRTSIVKNAKITKIEKGMEKDKKIRAEKDDKIQEI